MFHKTFKQQQTTVMDFHDKEFDDLISYEYTSPTNLSTNQVTQDDFLDNLVGETKYPFPTETLDLAMILLGEPRSNFDTVQIKLSLSKSGGHLDNRCFIRAAML